MNGAAVSAEHTRQQCKVSPWFMLSFVIPWGALMRLPRVKPGTGYCIPEQVIPSAWHFSHARASPTGESVLTTDQGICIKKRTNPMKIHHWGLLLFLCTLQLSFTLRKIPMLRVDKHLLSTIIKILQLKK